MNKVDLKKIFLNEIIMKRVSYLSVICGIISLGISCVFGNINLLFLFEEVIKIVLTLLTLWSFAKFRWDVMQGMMGALLFALLYQEGFLVLGKLWGETSDFDAFLIMGVQGSLYLAAQSMSFLMTVIIIVNHFIIDYSRVGTYENVIFNQLSILFKISLYIFLMIINVFLYNPKPVLANAGFSYMQDLCIVILIVFIETQLDDFKAIRQDLLSIKKQEKGK